MQILHHLFQIYTYCIAYVLSTWIIIIRYKSMCLDLICLDHLKKKKNPYKNFRRSSVFAYASILLHHVVANVSVNEYNNLSFLSQQVDAMMMMMTFIAQKKCVENLFPLKCINQVTSFAYVCKVFIVPFSTILFVDALIRVHSTNFPENY